VPERIDVVIVGGGHNGLVAACYLAMAGRRVRVLEATDSLGGAAISTRPFAGIDATIPPYAHLISLLPYRLRQDLGINLRTAKRRTLGYAPDPLNPAVGILVPQDGYPGLDASLDRLTGSTRDAQAWRAFRARTATLARAIFPTMVEPLRSRSQMRALVGDDGLWQDFIERPIGEVIERTFYDDLIRGMALTDGLIGTLSHAHDPSLRQNRCLLQHVIGNSTGEWEVPIGGMGALARALRDRAEELRVEITTGALVTGIEANGIRALVRAETALGQERIDCQEVLVNCAPGILDRLLGRVPASIAYEDAGAQVAVTMLLKRLPRLRDGSVDPTEAFSGTFFLNDSYRQLAAAHGVAGRGDLPSPIPAIVGCPSLTDPTILGPALHSAAVLKVLTLQSPHALFADGDENKRKRALRAVIESLNSVLGEPIETCLMSDADGRPCIDVHTPADIERDLLIPGGNIFHTPLDWPFADDPAEVGRWGVETDISNVTMCGAGARRGGGISGIPGQNAAYYVLTKR